MVAGTHHWRSGDISGAPVMSRLFNIMRGGRVHLDVPKGIEFPVGIRTLLNTSRYVTTCTSGLSSLKSTMSRLVFWASVPPFRMSHLTQPRSAPETVNRSRRPSKREPTTINIQLFRRVRNAGRSRKGMNRRPLSVDLGLLEPLEASQSTYGRQAVLDRSLGCKTTM